MSATKERARLIHERRAQGRRWFEIAAEFQGRYGVNARVAHRFARGWSQQQVAHLWCERWPDDPKTYKNISYWEAWPSRSGQAPSFVTLTRLAELYECAVSDLVSDFPNHREIPQGRPAGTAGIRDADDADVPLAAPSRGGQTSGPEMGGLEHMHRRLVMKALAITGVSATFPTPAGTDSGPLGSVEDWQEAVWEYGHSYFLSPRDEMLPDLVADLTAIMEGISTRRPDSPTVQRLAEPAALLAALVAKTCTDLGYGREATHAWRASRRLSSISESPDVQMWVQGNECMGAIYLDRPLPVVPELIEKGLNVKGDSPSGGRASLLGIKAQALSMQGRHVEAEAALNATQSAFADLPESVTNSRNSVFGWPEQMLRHGESYVHTHSGDTVKAHHAQVRALELYPSEQVVSRCQIELHRALCLVRDGHVSEGLDHATRAIEEIPPGRRQRLILTLAGKIVPAVPPTARRDAPFRNYHDLLMSSAGRHAAAVAHA